MNEPNKIEYLGDTKISEKDFLRKVKQFSEGVFKYIRIFEYILIYNKIKF